MRSPEQTAADFYRLDRGLGAWEALRPAFVDAEARLVDLLRQRDAEHAASWEGWQPTAEAVNALPEPLRRYVHDLETRCDPAGEVRELVIARETVEALEARLREERGRAFDAGVAAQREWEHRFNTLHEADRALFTARRAAVEGAEGAEEETSEP